MRIALLLLLALTAAACDQITPNAPQNPTNCVRMGRNTMPVCS